jgi:hypothetical protein
MPRRCFTGFAVMLLALLFAAQPCARAKPVDHYVLALS